MKCRFFGTDMSIAVSARILPSRILASMLALMLAIANAAIAYTGFSVKIDKITIFIFVFFSSLLSLFMLLRYYRRQQAVQLTISDSGAIIFRVMGSNSLNVKLSASSTLWPQLMLLFLCDDDGQSIVLPILRDSVDAATFRKLSVALRWVAMQASSTLKLDADISSGNF